MAEFIDSRDTSGRKERFRLNIFYLKNEESVHTFIKKLPRTIKVIQEKKKINDMRKFADNSITLSMVIESTLGEALVCNLCEFWERIRTLEDDMSWIQIIPNKRLTYMPQHPDRQIEGYIEFVGGSMISPSSFVKHWETIVTAEFQQDKSQLLVKDAAMKFEIKISSDFLHDYVIIDLQNNDTFLYFNVKYSPKLYAAEEPYLNDIAQTRLSASDLPFQKFGCLGCFCLKLKKDSPLVSRIIWYIQYIGLFVAYANVKVNFPKQEAVAPFTEYNTVYAWTSLRSQGFKVTDHITATLVEKIFRIKDPAQVFSNMVDLVAEKPFFHFMSELDEAIEMAKYTSYENKNNTSSNLTIVRRALLTPTKCVFLPKELVSQNRILRQYDEDYFIRLVYRDEDYQKLTKVPSVTLHNVLEDMKQIFLKGFKIHDRKYEFLGCSNSQLREHSFWFFSSYNGITAESIRQSAGDLSKERCVASYVSRFGLCFSASRHTMDVGMNQEVQYETDIERNGYCFTDGIGKISQSLASKVAEAMNLPYVPSAFQIRFGGCKGVVAQDPSLGEKDVLVLRESMRKFQSNSTGLEVLEVTRPGRLHLNRQIITLLSGLGIPDEIFLDLQEKMLVDLSDMLLYDMKALQRIQQVALDINFQELSNKGVSFVREPFFRSLLLGMFQQRLYDMKMRSRIQIPLDKGRYMMGTSDETQSLQYGQVFIQYSKELSRPRKDLQIVLGKVIITKNPCFYPGDIRIFEAVKNPYLGHMVDCVVFPQLGPRPHPDEMSGSDLDGDEYFVCWDERLYTFENENPMDFPKAEKTKLVSDVRLKDIVDFLANYIKNDNLGIIANAHLALADSEEEGVFSSHCLELAKLHSEAVDFPKTGKCPRIGKDICPEKYPDFMMKSDKIQYISSKILGKLYHQCQSFLNNIKRQETSEFLIDDELDSPLTNLTDKEREDANFQRKIYNEKLQVIMNVYGLENEFEAISGLIKRLKRKRGCLKNEEFQIGKIVREKVSSLMQGTRKTFFEEFDGEKSKFSCETEKLILRKARAWYTVTYKMSNSPFLSFPWVVADVLSKVKNRQEQRDAFEKVNTSLQQHWKLTEENRLITSSWINFLRNKVEEKTFQLTDSKWIDLFQNGIIIPKDCKVVLGFKSEDYHKIVSTMRHIASEVRNDQFEGNLCYMINLAHGRPGFVRLTADEMIIKLSGSLTCFLKQEQSLIKYVAQFLYEYFREQILTNVPNDVIEDILPIILLKESILDRSIPNMSSEANILFNCLRNVRTYMQSIVDRKDLPTASLKWLIKNKEEIVVKSLVGFMEISQSLSVQFLNDEDTGGFESSESFVFSAESLNITKYAFIYVQFKFQQITGADVYLHYDDVGQTRVLKIEAHGTKVQLLRLSKVLCDFLAKSTSISTAKRGQTTVQNTFSASFEGCTSNDELINFNVWSGPCHSQHHHETRFLPYLVHGPELPEWNNFEQTFSIQWEKIKDEYNPIFHGDLSIVLSFGTFYFMNVDKYTMAVSELNERLQNFKVRRGIIPKPFSFSFFPMSDYSNNLISFLERHFIKVDTQKELKVRLSYEGMCDLDEHMNFVQYNAPQVKWLIHHIILMRKRQSRTGNQPCVRCKIQSFRTLNRRAIEAMDGYEWIFDTGAHIVKSNDGFVVTDPNVKFIREKETDIYTNINLNVHEGVWRSIRVEVSKVNEYDVKYRQCTKMSEKTEVVIIPGILDLNSSDEEVKKYSKQLWDIALHFGKQLDD
ncbi:uncharacterized protein LOC133194972 [Saccostrea echinata]|uniref:uncharacterized protein LOC133194972 n=1 Tax=Saccostrea echinata TaxID=191078 RepID=UPI002A83A188|nr:uncharacterized protein LOC133194972 [Saccostrea echinata]